MQKTTKFISLLMAACLALAGCGSQSDGTSDKHQIKVKLNQTIDADSKWIDSSIEGAIDENTSVSLKDDFYTAVNKDWIASVTLEEEEDSVDIITSTQKVLAKRLRSIIFGTEDPEAFSVNQVGYPEDQIKHNEQLLTDFTAKAADWDQRNIDGLEPLRPYIEKIEQISDLSEMTSYMTSVYDDNFSADQFFDTDVNEAYSDNTRNNVVIDQLSSFALEKATNYRKSNLEGCLLQSNNRKFVTRSLSALGYTESEVEKILRGCYHFECRLVDLTLGSTDEDYKGDNELCLTYEELKALQGNFPLTEILDAFGYGEAEKFYLYHDNYIKGLSSLYTESHLDEMKDFYIVHTILSMYPLLDREAYDEYSSVSTSSTTDSGDGDTNDSSTGDAELDIILNSFTAKYLQEPLDSVYVARYGTPEEKEKLQTLVEDVKDAFKVIVDSEDWLTDEAKTLTKEKVDSIRSAVLYPDQYRDYTELNFAPEDSLVEMVSKINRFNLDQKCLNIGQPITSDFNVCSTTTINAFYAPRYNKIFITYGIISNQELVKTTESTEELYGTIGAIIGHEISHAFDKTGIKYDKAGYENTWMGLEDRMSYTTREVNLQSYYSALIPFPGGKTLNGVQFSGEATADMGGVKCMLTLAKDIPDFDYDLFFRSFAKLWAKKTTYDYESELATGDSHPLANLRVNVTLQQFDEFIETYDIEEGDGMYLAPDKRISIW